LWDSSDSDPSFHKTHSDPSPKNPLRPTAVPQREGKRLGSEPCV